MGAGKESGSGTKGPPLGVGGETTARGRGRPPSSPRTRAAPGRQGPLAAIFPPPRPRPRWWGRAPSTRGGQLCPSLSWARTARRRQIANKNPRARAGVLAQALALALRPGTSSLQAAAKISEKLRKAWFSVLLKRILGKKKTKKQKTENKRKNPKPRVAETLRTRADGLCRPAGGAGRTGRGPAAGPAPPLLRRPRPAAPRPAPLRCWRRLGLSGSAAPRGSSPSCCSHSAASP